MARKSKAYNTVGGIIAFESGELDQDAVVEFFQHLVDSGIVWQLQGSYQRTACNLIDAGLVVAK